MDLRQVCLDTQHVPAGRRRAGVDQGAARPGIAAPP